MPKSESSNKQLQQYQAMLVRWCGELLTPSSREKVVACYGEQGGVVIRQAFDKLFTMDVSSYHKALEMLHSVQASLQKLVYKEPEDVEQSPKNRVDEVQEYVGELVRRISYVMEDGVRSRKTSSSSIEGSYDASERSSEADDAALAHIFRR